MIWGYQNSQARLRRGRFPARPAQLHEVPLGRQPEHAPGRPLEERGQQGGLPDLSRQQCRFGLGRHPQDLRGIESGKDLTNAQCKQCHITGGNLGPDVVHWNQNEENAAKYKMVIESAAYDAASRNVTVKYYLSDPTNSNAKYNLLTTGCTGSGTSASCPNTEKFGNLRFYVAYQALVGQPTAVTEFSSYNNGGSGANQYAYKGTNDGSNNYTVEITLPADTATSVAAGTARVVTIGQIKEPLLVAKSAANPRPEVVPQVLINTLAQNTYKDVVLTGTMNPRREIVSNEKCNVCHGALGATSGSNTLANAFHSGARNTVEACALCHDANRSSSTVMTSGLQLQESYQFKRMIHGIHGNSKRTYPFQHGNRVWGEWSKDGILLTEGLNTRNTPPTPVPAGSTWLDDVENYAAEVAWPGVGINCNACHVNNSYKQDRGPLGAVISTRPTGSNPQTWQVISPKAASCTACHDSAYALGHVTSFGGASFGNATIGDLWTKPRETCDDCHASGGFKAVDYVHNQK